MNFAAPKVFRLPSCLIFTRFLLDGQQMGNSMPVLLLNDKRDNGAASLPWEIFFFLLSLSVAALRCSSMTGPTRVIIGWQQQGSGVTLPVRLALSVCTCGVKSEWKSLGERQRGCRRAVSRSIRGQRREGGGWMDTATLTSPFLSARAVTRLLVAPTHTAQCQAAGLASVSAIRSAGRLVWTLLQISVRKLRKTFFLFKFIYLFKKKKKQFGAYDWCDCLYGKCEWAPIRLGSHGKMRSVFYAFILWMRIISVREHVPMTTVGTGDTLTIIYCTQLCKSLSTVIKICP